MNPLIYIAGPLTIPNPMGNTRIAVQLAEKVETYDCDVYVPHLTIVWALISSWPHARWLERDDAILRRCDALWRIPGKSAGADHECDLAQELGLPIFWGDMERHYVFTDLERWRDKWKPS